MTLAKDHPSYSYSFHLRLSHIDSILSDMLQDPGPIFNYESKPLTFYFSAKILFPSFHEISWTTSSMVALNKTITKFVTTNLLLIFQSI